MGSTMSNFHKRTGWVEALRSLTMDQWAVVLVKELLWAVLLDLRFGDLPSKQVFL